MKEIRNTAKESDIKREMVKKETKRQQRNDRKAKREKVKDRREEWEKEKRGTPLTTNKKERANGFVGNGGCGDEERDREWGRGVGVGGRGRERGRGKGERGRGSSANKRDFCRKGHCGRLYIKGKNMKTVVGLRD